MYQRASFLFTLITERLKKQIYCDFKSLSYFDNQQCSDVVHVTVYVFLEHN